MKTLLLNKIRSGAVRHVGLYTAGTIVSKGISFIALPFFTFYISEAGFGILALITNSILLLNGFVLFSTNITLNAEYFKTEKTAYNNLFTSFFYYVISTTVISALIIAVFYEPLHRNFGFQLYYIWLIPFLTFLNFFTEQLNNFLRLRHQSTTFFICNTLKAAVEIGLAVLLLYVFRNDYYARIISIGVSSTLFAAYASYYFFVKMKLWGTFSFRLIRNELTFGVSIMIMQVANFLMGSSDKFFVRYFYRDELTGIYNVCSTLASVLFIFSSAMTAYLTPNIYSAFSDSSKDKHQVVKKYFVQYIAVIAGASLLVFAGGTITYFFLIKKTYMIGYIPFCFLLIGNVLYAVALFFFPVLWYFRARRKLITIAVISMISSGVLFYFLTRSYSITGTSLAFIGSYLILMLYVSRLTMRLLKTV